MQVIGMKLAFGLSSAVISIELGFLDQARVPLHSSALPRLVSYNHINNFHAQKMLPFLLLSLATTFTSVFLAC